MALVDVHSKFGAEAAACVEKISQPLIQHGVVRQHQGAYMLTDNGILVSNQVFEKFTFLENELD